MRLCFVSEPRGCDSLVAARRDPPGTPPWDHGGPQPVPPFIEAWTAQFASGQTTRHRGNSTPLLHVAVYFSPPPHSCCLPYDFNHIRTNNTRVLPILKEFTGVVSLLSLFLLFLTPASLRELGTSVRMVPGGGDMARRRHTQKREVPQVTAWGELMQEVETEDKRMSDFTKMAVKAVRRQAGWRAGVRVGPPDRRHLS